MAKTAANKPNTTVTKISKVKRLSMVLRDLLGLILLYRNCFSSAVTSENGGDATEESGFFFMRSPPNAMASSEEYS